PIDTNGERHVLRMADKPGTFDKPATHISLKGQTAIVTGASSGIGHATAVTLAAAGANVVVNHFPAERSKADAGRVVAEIADSGGTAVAVAADVSREDQVDK